MKILRLPILLMWICILLCVFVSTNCFPADDGTQSASKINPSVKHNRSRAKQSKEKKKATKKCTSGRPRAKNVCLNPMPPVREATCKSEVSLLPIIEKNKSLLKKQSVNYFPGSRKSLEQRDIKLALANLKTGATKIVSGRISGKTLSLTDKAVRFDVEWWNGFNTSINILEPTNTAVIAMLYALEPKRQRLYSRHAIAYTPYSSALLQPELVEAGRHYLLNKISRSRSELMTVKSQASFKSIAQSPYFTSEDYFNIIIAEQMDPERFCCLVCDDGRLTSWQQKELTRLAERILVIIGSNQEDAYSFTGSCAGARGITQFTAGGMSVVWDNYPDSGIIRNFTRATSDHIDAIKAEMCLLDFYLAQLCDAYPKLRGSGFEKYAAAAAYNGGPGRVIYGMEHFGLQWLKPWKRLSQLDSLKNLTYKEQGEYQWLKQNRYHETFIYLMKLNAMEQIQKNLIPDQMPLKSAKQVSSEQKTLVE